MDNREISKLQFGENLQEQQHTSPYFFHYPSSSLSFFTPNHHHTNFNNQCPMFSTMEFNNEIKDARAEDDDKGNSNSFTSSEDSSSDASDDEEVVSLEDELLFEGKTMKKIELLAAMVGVDSAEPVIVLTEVVRVLKLLKTMNQC